MPPEKGSAVIDRDQMYLCDSGGKAAARPPVDPLNNSFAQRNI